MTDLAMNISDDFDVKTFLAVSVVLTGFDEFELQGTGLVEDYHRLVSSEVPGGLFRELCRGVEGLRLALDEPVEFKEKHWPWMRVACAITQLWYLGVWGDVPKDSVPVGGTAHADDEAGVPDEKAFVVSPQAYVESLVWKTFGGHPMGAKPPGFGSWEYPPPDADPLFWPSVPAQNSPPRTAQEV